MINLYKEEKILVQRRKHWYAITSESSALFIAAIVPAVLFFGSLSHPATREAIGSFLPLITFAFSGWILLLWIVFFILWTNYYLDVLVVTNKRIIDIEQKGLFAHDVAEVSLDNVQDIKVEIFGIIASLFDFGDLHIQTAGASKEIVIKKIPLPHELRDIISEQMHSGPISDTEVKS